MLALVGSAFFARRLPLGQSAKMAVAWLAIFAVLFVGFSLRDDFTALGRRIMQGSGTVVAQGGEVRIRKGQDGHFSVDATLNGKSVRFLVDSGATVTSISSETAARADIEPSGLPAIVQTANGTVQVGRARAERLKVGSIERRNMAVHVSEAFGPMNVLGMNFLSSLSAWGVEGQWLVLKP